MEIRRFRLGGIGGRLKIIWTKWNHIQEVQYGRSLRGLKYKEERPDKIVIGIDEIAGHKWTQQFIHYVAKQLVPALSRSTSSEVSLVYE